MSNGVSIVSAANGLDGYSASVVISGTPSGPLSFWASRTPDVSNSLLCTHTGSNPYAISVPHPSLWYIWAKDDNGFTATPGAVWVGESDGIDLDEIGYAIRDVFLHNKTGLEAILRQDFPNITIKQIVYGSPILIEGFPSILVHRPRVSEQWVAFPWVKQHQYAFDIAFMLVHGDPQIRIQTVTRWTRAGMFIINQPAYETLVLPSGLVVNFCQASEGNSDEVDLGDVGFGVIGSLVWSGLALKQDTGG